MLQDINQSQNRRSKFSKMAMITLLNFNLPVKYALMGHLASTDKITDGFYDVGKVCKQFLYVKKCIFKSVEIYKLNLNLQLT